MGFAVYTLRSYNGIQFGVSVFVVFELRECTRNGSDCSEILSPHFSSPIGVIEVIAYPQTPNLIGKTLVPFRP